VVRERRRLFPKIFIFAVPALLLGEIASVLLRFKYVPAAGHEQAADMKTLSEMLFSTYLVPFELASILLLAVLVGAIIIARRKLLHDPD